ncbi:MAG: hypothetical protein AVDCRST_MAG37-288, partial [uncultured Rubrobacteraceae bacterium]
AELLPYRVLYASKTESVTDQKQYELSGDS